VGEHTEELSPETPLGYMGNVVPGELTVQVHRATDLEDKDMRGKSDPYVVVEYNEKRSKSDPISNDLNPEFDYSTSFIVQENGPTEITVELLDDDVGKDETLGKTSFNLREVIEQGQMMQVTRDLEGVESGRVVVSLIFNEMALNTEESPRRPAGSEISGTLASVIAIADPNIDMDDLMSPTNVLRRRPAPNGKLRLTLLYDEQREELKVFVHEAAHLHGENLPDPPDPYVKLYLMPGKKKKRKTDVVKDSGNPRFDEEFDFSIDMSDLQSCSIQATVVDKKGVFARSPVLGTVTIPLDNPGIVQGIADWFKLEEADEDSD